MKWALPPFLPPRLPALHSSLLSLHLWLWITDCEDYYEWMIRGNGTAKACVCVCVMSSQRQPCSISRVWFISRKPHFSDSPGSRRHNKSITHTHRGGGGGGGKKKRQEMTVWACEREKAEQRKDESQETGREEAGNERRKETRARDRKMCRESGCFVSDCG